MAAHRQKCHDWRLFIAAAAPGAPTSQIFAQVRAGYSDELRSRNPARHDQKSPSVTQNHPAASQPDASVPVQTSSDPPDPLHSSHSTTLDGLRGGGPTTTRSTS